MGSICNICNSNKNKTIEINNEDKYNKCKAKIVKKPDYLGEEYIIEINIENIDNNSLNEMKLLIIFNYPVNFIECSKGELVSSNNSTRILVKFNFENNQNNIKIKNFKVNCPSPDLEIVDCHIKE